MTLQVCANCGTELRDTHIGIYCPGEQCDELDGVTVEEVPEAFKLYAVGQLLTHGWDGDGDFINCGDYTFLNPYRQT